MGKKDNRGPALSSLFGIPLHRFSPEVQFVILAIFVFATELSYGVCQEIFFGVHKFRYNWFSTFVQFNFYAFFSFVHYVVTWKKLPSFLVPDFPYMGHLMIAANTLLSRVLGNTAFAYMGYGLKVLFTSANSILVMVAGILFFKKTYTMVEYLSTAMLAFGLFLFCVADARVPGAFNLFGVLLMFGSVSTDALKFSVQEKVMKQNKCTEVDVTLWSSLIGVLLSFVAVIYTGQLWPSIDFFVERPESLKWMALVFCFGYASSIAMLSLIVLSNAFIASIVSTARKALTVFISSISFGKQFTPQHLIAIVIFFGGISWHSYEKHTKKKESVPNTKKTK